MSKNVPTTGFDLKIFNALENFYFYIISFILNKIRKFIISLKSMGLYTFGRSRHRYPKEILTNDGSRTVPMYRDQ